MKMRQFGFLNLVPVVLAFFLFTGCSGIQKIDTAQLHNIDLSTIDEQQDLSILTQMVEGKPLEEPVVMKLPQGFRLPVQLTLKSPLAELNSSCGTMVFSQDLFLYLTQSGLMVSPDKINWVNFSDVDAIKELFGWSGGNLAIGIGASQNQGAILKVKVGVLPVKRQGESN